MYQFNDVGTGNGGGAAALSLDTVLRRPAIGRCFGQRLATLDTNIDLVTDLGARIGSRDWFRGLATCVALCAAAWSFAPGLEPVVGATPAPLTDAQYDEARALSFAPLAYGADTGRRMAPTDAVQELTDTPERPRVDLTATLGRGVGFASVLQRSGVAEAEALLVEKLVTGAIPLEDVKAGTPVQITLGRRADKRMARPLDSLTFRARFDLAIEVVRVDGRLALKSIPIAVDNTPLRIQGLVGDSLWRAARASGAPGKAIQAYLRAIATQMNVGSIGANDRFDLIVERRRAATGETEIGKLLYAGLERANGKTVQLMQWEQGGRSQWFEASGVGRESGLMQRPVPGAVSSNFGKRRHPILGYTRMHKGMDFRAGHGTPILAAADGRVTRSGRAGGYGKQVKISHDGGISTSYSHMSRIVANRGERVRKGEVIGYVGSTGLSTGPHLHYEMYRNGVAVNPASVKFTTRAQLGGSDLAKFKAELRRLLAVPAGASAVQSASNESAATPKI